MNVLPSRRRWLTLAAALATGLWLLPTAAGSAAATAAGSWKIQAAPSPGSGAMLYGVSCLSAANCMAVGSYSSGTLAEHWNGTAWKPQATPNPAGAYVVYLNSVSCSSGGCTAVGSYQASSGLSKALAERWNGTTWAVQSTPSPSVPDVFNVSCSSPAACTMAGDEQNGSSTVPLAERWNGSAWAQQAVPVPSGSSYAMIIAVSCPAASSDCEAVGDYQIDSGGGIQQRTLVERYTG